MQNKWRSSDGGSGLKPLLFTSGEAPPPPSLPPDPPDHSLVFPFNQYPPLSPSFPKPARLTAATSVKSSQKIASSLSTKVRETTSVPQTTSVPLLPSASKVRETGAATVQILGSEPATLGNFTILKPRSSSPLQTNKASASLPTIIKPSLPVSSQPQSSTVHENPISQKPATISPLQVRTTPLPHFAQRPTPLGPTLAEKLRVSEDKSLRRLAPITIGESGRPRVLIPDAVFKKGEELHKDFIICYYNGKAPPFNQIQSVFNHMWGKGKKLEIHNNPLNRSTIVRISSDYLREKILDKCIWYVGDTMFHTALWSSAHSSVTPPLSSIKIWAHLHDVPIDLRHEEGLSLIAGLVGDPKETDDFTKNLVSLTLAHVKVEVDLTKPLPSIVEFERESGDVVEVIVTYPWVPPTCSHCHELGHIVRNCLKWTPAQEENTTTKGGKKPVKESRAKDLVSTSIPNSGSEKTMITPSSSLVISDQVMVDVASPSVTLPLSAPGPSTAFSPIASSHHKKSFTRLPPKTSFAPFIVALPATVAPPSSPIPYSPPETQNKCKVLKRSYSDPSLYSPPKIPDATILFKGVSGVSSPVISQISVPLKNSFVSLINESPIVLGDSTIPSL
ncbi:hypothetical protein N665_0098s0046 [Sinapis alba]|nr:hypothetical protein N665_0098s0046 [Sinapis alba]